MRKLIAILVIIAFIFAGLYYASPYWTVYNMAKYVKAGNGKAVLKYIDLPSLKENLKIQLKQKILEEARKSGKTEDTMAAAFGMALIDPIVDAMLTESSVVALLSGTYNQNKQDKATHRAEESKRTTGEKCKPIYTTHYGSLSVFILEVGNTCVKDNRVNLILERRGPFSWKVVNIVLPKGSFQ